MKVLSLMAILAFSTLSVAAERITVLEDQITRAGYNLEPYAKFYMDTETGIGYADVTVDLITFTWVPGRGHCDRFGCYGGGSTRVPMRNRIYSNRVEVPGLNLIDKQMIYTSTEGEINCGKLGRSRWLRRSTLFLSGNCKLRTTLDRRGNLTATFIVK